MSITNYKDLLTHIGHEIVCVEYKPNPGAPPDNVAIECQTCNVVITSFDRDEAEDEPHYASVGWTANDVLDDAGSRNIPMTRDEAEAFLAKNEKHIREAMTERGFEAISTFMDMDGFTP